MKCCFGSLRFVVVHGTLSLACVSASIATGDDTLAADGDVVVAALVASSAGTGGDTLTAHGDASVALTAAGTGADTLSSTADATVIVEESAAGTGADVLAATADARVVAQVAGTGTGTLAATGDATVAAGGYSWQGTKSVDLDGSTQCLTCDGVEQNFDWLGTTVLMWLKTDTPTVGQTPFTYSSSSNANTRVRWFVTGLGEGRINAKDDANNTDIVGATDPFPYAGSGWTHVAVVFDSDSTTRAYVNGVLEASYPTFTPGTYTLNQAVIGCLDVAGVRSAYWNGHIAEKAQVGKALSASEVGVAYNSGVPHDLTATAFGSDVDHYHDMSNDYDDGGTRKVADIGNASTLYDATMVGGGASNFVADVP